MNTRTSAERPRLWLSIHIREARESFLGRVKTIRHSAGLGIMIDAEGKNPQRFFTTPEGEQARWNPWLSTGLHIRRHVQAVDAEFKPLAELVWAKAADMVKENPQAFDIAYAELHAFLEEMRCEVAFASRLTGDTDTAGDHALNSAVRQRFEDEYRIHRLEHGLEQLATDDPPRTPPKQTKQTKPKPPWYPMLRDEYELQDKKQAEFRLKNPLKSLPQFPKSPWFRKRLISRGFEEQSVAPSTLRYHKSALDQEYGR